MNTKNNKRRRDSVARIERTFVEQLQTQELSEIRVSELCKCAGVNRSTFYSNFIDIYDLADKLRDDLVQEVRSLYTHKEFTGDAEDMLTLFCHIRDNQLFYKTFFKLGYDNRSNIYLYDFELSSLEFDSRYVDYHYEFFRGGFNALLKLWLDGGCRETPEEMNEILLGEYRGRLKNEKKV